MATTGTTLRINVTPSIYLRQYIQAYANVTRILEEGSDYLTIETTMTTTQITTFKNDVLNHVIEII